MIGVVLVHYVYIIDMDKCQFSSSYLIFTDTFFPQVSQSVFFNEAANRAQVQFSYHNILECNYNGLEHTIEDHDITLRIPKGAVVEGKKIHFEIAVAMHGPFVFIEGTQPISPFLWLCLMEEDYTFTKPFQVILPHYLTGLNKERMQCHNISFAKASHNDYVITNNNQMVFKLQRCDIKPAFASNGYRSYGVLVANHCCFYCLVAEPLVTREQAADAGYFLLRIEYVIPHLNRMEVYFCATFFLETCLKVSNPDITPVLSLCSMI